MNPILPPKLESTETHTWHRALASNWWELRPVLCERAPGIVNTLFCLLLQRALLLFYSQSDYIFLLGRYLKGQKEAGENCILLIDNCVSIHFCPFFKVIYVRFWVWWCVITSLNKRKKNVNQGQNWTTEEYRWKHTTGSAVLWEENVVAKRVTVLLVCHPCDTNCSFIFQKNRERERVLNLEKVKGSPRNS